MLKQCKVCGMVKPLESFAKGRAYKDGYRSRCTTCENEYKRHWRETRRAKGLRPNTKNAYNPLLKRMEWVKYRFGLSATEYNELMQQQQGRCAICGAEASQDGRRLAVDHDHATGAIRGLLCRNCNFGVGWFQDNPALLARAIDYLQNHRSASIVNAS